MTDLGFTSAARLARLIAQRKIGCLELLEHYIHRVEQHNPALNALINTRYPAARKQARLADQQAARRGFQAGPLFGVPMTIKESFDIKGMATTWGLPEFAQHRAARHAAVVDKLIAAGANIFAKSNVPVYLANWQTYNPIYGTTNNPWDLGRTPGGSSGGAAAALASGISALEYGSDIGASIRNPAHYCGVYGHKPTFGIVSSEGQTLDGAVSEPDIAVVGPLARSAADLRLALNATAGPDPIAANGWRLALARPAFKSLTELRVAVMPSAATAEADASVQDAITALAKALRKLGAKVSYKARPAIDTSAAHNTYIELLRFATAASQPDSQFAAFEKRKKRIDESDHRYLAQLIRGTTMAPRRWSQLNEHRHQMRLAWAEFFKKWDVLLCPAAATPAFKHNQRGERWEQMIDVNGKPQPVTTQMFWAGFSGVSFLPSTVAPIGLSADGLPIGVQIVGPQYGDLATIRAAELIEKHYYRFAPPPGY